MVFLPLHNEVANPMRCLLYAPLDEKGLPPELTFTRAAGPNSYQTGPAVNGTTFIALNAGVNVARYHYIPALGRRCLLIEGARTNELPRSDFGDADTDDLPDAGGVDWTLGAGVAGTDFNTVTTGGPTGAAYFQLEDTAVANRGVHDAAVLAAGTTHTSSLFVRRTGTAGAATLRGHDTNPGISTIDIGTGPYDWTWCQGSAATVGAGATGYCLEGNGDPAGVVQGVCPQIENGQFASTWIPSTTGAATRAAEVCGIAVASVPRYQGRLRVTFCPAYASTDSHPSNQFLFRWNGGAYIEIQSSNRIRVIDGFVQRVISPVLTWSRWGILDVEVVYGPDGISLITNAQVATTTTAWGGAAINAPELGSFGGTGQAFGAFANLSLWG